MNSASIAYGILAVVFLALGVTSALLGIYWLSIADWFLAAFLVWASISCLDEKPARRAQS